MKWLHGFSPGFFFPLSFLVPLLLLLFFLLFFFLFFLLKIEHGPGPVMRNASTPSQVFLYNF